MRSSRTTSLLVQAPVGTTRSRSREQAFEWKLGDVRLQHAGVELCHVEQRAEQLVH
jgi:hypothetical protein